MWFDRVRELTLAMVRVPSVTRSQDERAFAEFHRDLLLTLPYFQVHPEHLRLIRTENDPYERSSLFALAKGQGRRTLILTGHYDVVGTDNYGNLQPHAFDPEALLPRLIEFLKLSPANHRNSTALKDLESGAFLPGRAALDMKSGLAAGIAVLERFTQLAEPVGNLLYIAVPDEEHSSAGMRSVMLQLPHLLAEWDLEVTAAINLDAVSDDGEGELGRSIALGTVGKLLPVVMLVGRAMHASYPFSGVNANFLAAELIRHMELNPDVADTGDAFGELAPPPVCLRQGDYLTHYDVTAPHQAWCAFNYLSHTLSPEAVYQRVHTAVQTCMESALALLRARAQKYGADHQINWVPRVMSFDELVDFTAEHVGSDTVQEVFAKYRHLDPLDCARAVTGELAGLSELDGPAAVIGFGSIYYPRTHLTVHPQGQRFWQMLKEEAEKIAAETGRSYSLRPFFSGISDMSFLAGHDDAADLALVERNTPAFRANKVDYQRMQQVTLPAVNIGPWGRDYHQPLERVHMHDTFEVLPELLWRIVCRDLAM
ncbi:MAG TPA: M20/M25/M40 family metallo-hydrolase [Symbiobacteriaceae bacterium]|nr:M20/M25/M40 family metallo-hydrolase [Symbiobacteriaceae bacterium]